MSFLDHDDKTEFAMHYGTAKQHHKILDAGPSFNTLKVMATRNPHKEIVDRMIDHPVKTGAEDHMIHSVIAQSTTHADHLDKLMKHPHREVRAAVAANEHLSTHHIEHMMHDPDDTVAHRISRRSGIMQPHQREHLSNHPDELVVGEIARHPSMHEKLVDHPDAHVRNRVAQYTSKTEHLDKLTHDPEENVRASVAANRHTSQNTTHIHSILMHDPSDKVRQHVIANTMNKEVAAHLSNDKNHNIAHMAKDRFEYLDHAEYLAKTKKPVSEGLVGFKQFSETI